MCVDGRVDKGGWMDGRVDEGDGWMDDGCMEKRVDEWMGELMKMDGWTDR